ncbi:MAG TPA: molybdopterin-binding protein [Mariprofundaceae bacterium]|nr:molybdopterin-binding protein [Mariprofundaceae bacterium]
MTTHKTIAILVIGNEVLSGRTREANAYLAAQKLFDRGCKLGEIAVVPDIHDAIASTLNRMRQQFDAVITSGGIGPTHDDITMDSVADAFGVDLIEHKFIVKVMTERFGEEGMNDGRRRMTRVPQGSHLIRCEKTIAPGALIGNVYVLAGVPYIFESQLDSILSDFGDSEHPFIRHEIDVELPESTFAKGLEAIQNKYTHVEIGSYPRMCGHKPCGKICLNSQDRAALNQATKDVEALMESIKA